jgi:hypothetical protein
MQGGGGAGEAGRGIDVEETLTTGRAVCAAAAVVIPNRPTATTAVATTNRNGLNDRGIASTPNSPVVASYFATNTCHSAVTNTALGNAGYKAF